MLIDCKCGATNRLPPPVKGMRQRARCGKCKHVFEIHEMVRARAEPPPPPPPMPDLPFGLGDGAGFDIGDLDLDTVTDEDLVNILLNGRGRAADGWSPFDNGLPLGTVREELVKEVMPKLRRKCFPKIQHATRGAAETQLHDVLVHGNAKNKSLIHTYLCPHCGQWHVGHSTPKR